MAANEGATILSTKLKVEAEEKNLKVKEEALLESVRILAAQPAAKSAGAGATAEPGRPDTEKEAAVGRYIREKSPGLFDSIAEKAS